ncbi:MAG TPA: flagellar biosynthetic protein FliR [Candidatus Latescibacteria bacterium]|nr:flagellar biosynthetic protein FliR [Candidatus Handelsmanbacteria bacterium]HIL08493.1 flagellar biosynthetic protein FliR [Candidatus Latescibacterota bacterium]
MSYWLDEFHIFLLILLRVSALLIVAPIFGHRLFLARAKVGLAVMVSMVIFPTVDRFDVPVGFLPYAVMMVGEVIMGLVIGYAVLLLFIGIQFAGQLAGLQMGFGIVNVIDPASHDQVSIIGQFLNILAILLMLTLDGHHIILNGLMTSFDAVPLGGVVLKVPVAQKMIALTAEVFVIAIKISAPIMIALFLISTAMGVLARTVPQMNVFIVGFPVQLGVGMSILMATLPLFQIMIERALKLLERDVFALIDFFA